MSKNNVISLENPDENADILTGLLRPGGKELITKEVQVKLAEFLSLYLGMTDDLGRRQVLRNGYLPERRVMTGLGCVDIKVSKTRDRSGQKIHFRSELLTPYIKRTEKCGNGIALALPQRSING